MIKGIIFDLDGTLLNTIKDIRTSLNITLKHFGYEEISIRKTKQSVGYGSQELVRRVLPRNTTADRKYQATNYYIETYNDVSGKYTKPYRGILKLLEQLKKQGYKLAVASNKSEKLVIELNEQIFKGLFDVTCGLKKGVISKPHPQMINTALTAMGLTKDEVLYVGDTEVDIRTARNAKLNVVAVTWGFRSSDQLYFEHPDHLIRRPNQLIKILEEINYNK